LFSTTMSSDEYYIEELLFGRRMMIVLMVLMSPVSLYNYWMIYFKWRKDAWVRTFSRNDNELFKMITSVLDDKGIEFVKQTEFMLDNLIVLQDDEIRIFTEKVSIDSTNCYIGPVSEKNRELIEEIKGKICPVLS